MCKRLKLTSVPWTQCGAAALAMLLGSSLPLPSHAAEHWKVDYAKSKFDSNAYTLALYRDNDSKTAGNAEAGARPYLVISKGKVYMEMNKADLDTLYGARIRAVDYPGRSDVKLVQVGENVRVRDLCGFRCQAGLPEQRMTVTFTTNGAEPIAWMKTILAHNRH